MAKKTVIRRAAKYWPLPEDAAMAIERDDRDFGAIRVSCKDETKSRLAAAWNQPAGMQDEPKQPVPAIKTGSTARHPH